MTAIDPLELWLKALAADRSDEQAWTGLYKQMRPYIFTVAYRKLSGQSEPAEEITQDVFLRLVRYCPFERLQAPEAFRAYVCQVVGNEVNRTMAKTGRRFKVDATLKPDQTSTEPSEQVLADEAWKLVTSNLNKIDRLILKMSSEGHSGKAIAAKLQMTPNNVAVRLFRARKLARNLLKSVENGN